MYFCPSCGARYSDGTRFCAIDGEPLAELPSVPDDPYLGQTIARRYLIETKLGEGGMGVVYRATHVALRKHVAIKVLRGSMASDSVTVARFVQEAQASTAIGHPNIVDISDFGQLDDGSSYFVMEYLEGESLKDRIQRGPLEVAEVIAIAEQVASALGAAHARSIVHRDLKPDNIFLARRGAETVVKILDFGIAKVGGAASKLTKTGMIFGTPHYMSPEQAAGQSVDLRADVYALGIILFEMCTGVVPFDGDTFMGILSKHMFEPAPRPTERMPSAHPLEPVVLRALAKKPEDRYPSMDALMDDLRAIREGRAVVLEETVAAPVPNVGLDAFDEAPVLPRRSALPWVVSLTALAVVGAAAGAIYAWVGTKGDALVDGAVATATPNRGPAAVAPVHVSVTNPVEVGAREEPAAEDQPSAAPAESFVLLESRPEGATVATDDDVLLGTTPLRIPRPADGATTLIVQAPGHATRRISISEATGDSLVATLEPNRTARVRATSTMTRRPVTTTAPDTRPAPQPEPPPSRARTEVVDPWN